MGVCFAGNLGGHMKMIWNPQSWVGAAKGRPHPTWDFRGRPKVASKIVLYMAPQIARKTDTHTDPYTVACGVSWGVHWVSPGWSPGGCPPGVPWGSPRGGWGGKQTVVTQAPNKRDTAIYPGARIPMATPESSQKSTKPNT